jgi:endonuclease YncB( thermonuclease family)
MRPPATGVLAVAGLAGLCLSVVLSGRAVAPGPAVMPAAAGTEDRQPEIDPEEADVPVSQVHARAVGENLVAMPDVDSSTLVREEARGPLSALSQALPPPKPDTRLFYRPVASASAVFESMGYRVAIAGTESVGPDETCTRDGITWACGMQARTAVRLWVRGRAFTCKFPDKNSGDVVLGCWLGKQDVGAWIVSNGWARAAPDGPYVQAEAKARKAGMGIFGAPPAAERWEESKGEGGDDGARF